MGRGHSYLGCFDDVLPAERGYKSLFLFKEEERSLQLLNPDLRVSNKSTYTSWIRHWWKALTVEVILAIAVYPSKWTGGWHQCLHVPLNNLSGRCIVLSWTSHQKYHVLSGPLRRGDLYRCQLSPNLPLGKVQQHPPWPMAFEEITF